MAIFRLAARTAVAVFRLATQTAVAAPEQLPKAARKAALTTASNAATADRSPLVKRPPFFDFSRLFQYSLRRRLGLVSALKGLAASLLLLDNRWEELLKRKLLWVASSPFLPSSNFLRSCGGTPTNTLNQCFCGAARVGWCVQIHFVVSLLSRCLALLTMTRLLLPCFQR